MKRIPLGIDMDDVLLSFCDPLCRFHNARFGTSLGREHYVSYDLTHTWQCSESEAVSRVIEFYETPEHLNAEPIPGSISAIKRLRHKYDPYVISAKPEKIALQMEHWLELHYKKAFSRAIFTNQYGAEGVKKRSKVEVCKELGIGKFIEDSPSQCLALAIAGVEVLMLDYPWNKTVPYHQNITRVMDWPHIESLL